MGKMEGSSSSSWFNTVKKAFSSPKKLVETKQKKTSKRREEDHQQDDEHRSKKRRWINNFTRKHHQQATVILQHCGVIHDKNKSNVATSSKESQVLAVAMATTAAAHAAIASAQAAVEAARLANNPSVLFRKHFAAVSIQTSFRGYLARRALRALKGVVKLQALVRGQNMRRRTQLTLHSIQSLLRIQARVLDHQRNTRRLSFEAGQRQMWRENCKDKEREAVRYASEGDNDHYLEGRWIDHHDNRISRSNAGQNQDRRRASNSDSSNTTTPRYMAATASAKSRLIRPHSAPKQRLCSSSLTNSPNQKQPISTTAKKRLSFPDGGDHYDYISLRSPCLEQSALPRISTSSSCVSSSLWGSSQ